MNTNESNFFTHGLKFSILYYESNLGGVFLAEHYNAEIQYDEQAVRTLANMQYRVFGGKIRIAVIAVCCVFLAIGVLGNLSTAWRIFFLMLGCIPIPSINLPAKIVAERVIKRFNGHLPSMSYDFGGASFHVETEQGSQDVRYSDVFRLIEDDHSLFILMQNKSAYLLNRDGNFADIKKRLSQCTGFGWVSPRKFTQVSLRTLVQDFRATRIRSK